MSTNTNTLRKQVIVTRKIKNFKELAYYFRRTPKNVHFLTNKILFIDNKTDILFKLKWRNEDVSLINGLLNSLNRYFMEDLNALFFLENAFKGITQSSEWFSFETSDYSRCSREYSYEFDVKSYRLLALSAPYITCLRVSPDLGDIITRVQFAGIIYNITYRFGDEIWNVLYSNLKAAMFHFGFIQDRRICRQAMVG